VLCKQLSDSASDGSPHRQGVLQKTLGKPRLRDLEVIAIDEIYAGRRNKFFTIVIDWRSGAIVYVGTGKGQDALNPFWKLLRGSGAKKKAVSTDMSSAYHAAVVKHLPQAKQVFDRFHLVKLMNEKLTQRRRDLQREAETMNRKVLTGTRWPLINIRAIWTNRRMSECDCRSTGPEPFTVSLLLPESRSQSDLAAVNQRSC